MKKYGPKLKEGIFFVLLGSIFTFVFGYRAVNYFLVENYAFNSSKWGFGISGEGAFVMNIASSLLGVLFVYMGYLYLKQK